MAYLSTAVASGGASDDVIKNHADEIKNWVEEIANTSESIDRTDFGELYINAGDYANTAQGEKNFGKDALKQIDELFGVSPNENIIVGHQVREWGYGRSRMTVPDINAKVCTVYVGSYITKQEKGLMCWHEAGHNWGAGHIGANYDLEPPSGSFVVDATPMIASYCVDANGNTRTTFCGESDGLKQIDCSGPDPLKNGKPNDPTGDYEHNPGPKFKYEYAENAEDTIETTLDEI